MRPFISDWIRLPDSHPLEVELNFLHNHVIKYAVSLSFRPVKEEVHTLYLRAINEQESLETFADRAHNPGYDYTTVALFRKYGEEALGSQNGEFMFKRLEAVVGEYNNSGRGKAVLQEYDARIGKSFNLWIVTNLMCRVRVRVLQANELCYMDASAYEYIRNASIY
ncbi:hypothetical protein RclHR1_00670026 [Rhizophagus clarus]|uniref:Uncharacterized protein n=1 Tax=Rhizophagus clarus TaxID=94130 RepID=A0A2Z6RTZ0_9GLOM|nr:hypothetical protein RclHR1_00670026 [Rhizophagus clarus]